jgi:hypothetical protein
MSKTQRAKRLNLNLNVVSIGAMKHIRDILHSEFIMQGDSAPKKNRLELAFNITYIDTCINERTD